MLAACRAVPAELRWWNYFRNHRVIVIASAEWTESVKHMSRYIGVMIGSPGENDVEGVFASGTHRLILEKVGGQQESCRREEYRDD